MINLLKHELFSRWVAILGWGIGLALFGIMYIAMYPQIGEQLSVLDIPIYQTLGMDMSSFEGFMASSVVQFIPIMLAIYVVISSTETLAGEEDNGTLELIVTMPLERWKIVAMKSSALAVITLIILMITGIGCAIALIWIKTLIAIDVTATQLFIAILSGWPITLAFLMMGLFFGAVLPNRRIASMTITSIILVSYFGKVLTGFVESLSFLKPVFLFSHFDTSADLFLKGIQPEDIWFLFSVAVSFFVLAVLSFEHRDITVGLWPWQRSRARKPKANFQE